MITAIVSAPLPEGLTFDQYTENTIKIVDLTNLQKIETS